MGYCTLTSKSIVLAMVALLVLTVPVGVIGVLQTAQAQLGDDIASTVLDNLGLGDGGANDNNDNEDNDDNQDLSQTQDQENDQENDQDQTARNDVDQSNDQSESNVVANDLHTGDNTATVAQSNEEDQQVSADTDADGNVQNAASEADAEDDDHYKAKKSYVSDSDTTSAGSEADAIISATAEATGIQGDQNNSADVDQDSSVHDVDLSNNVAFAEDTNTQLAVPIIDQDERSEQNAANLAANLAANVDLEEYGRTLVIPLTEEDEDNGPPFGQGGGRGPED